MLTKKKTEEKTDNAIEPLQSISAVDKNTAKFAGKKNRAVIFLSFFVIRIKITLVSERLPQLQNYKPVNLMKR